MAGWDNSVYRQTNGGASPATPDSGQGTCIAWWGAGPHGVDWLDELWKAGKAFWIGDSPGYPCDYTAMARDLVPNIVDRPPHFLPVNGSVLVYPPDGIVRDTASIDRDALAACRPDEWLIVEAWDRS